MRSIIQNNVLFSALRPCKQKIRDYFHQSPGSRRRPKLLNVRLHRERGANRVFFQHDRLASKQPRSSIQRNSRFYRAQILRVLQTYLTRQLLIFRHNLGFVGFCQHNSVVKAKINHKSDRNRGFLWRYALSYVQTEIPLSCRRSYR